MLSGLTDVGGVSRMGIVHQLLAKPLLWWFFWFLFFFFCFLFFWFFLNSDVPFSLQNIYKQGQVSATK